MTRLASKKIVVTGGANGLGAEYVKTLHSNGARVAILDRDSNAGERLASALGERCIFQQADVTDPAQVRAAFAKAASALDGLNVLVNNAGIYPHTALESIGLEEWRHVMRTNLESVFICTKEAVEYMKVEGSGKIVNVTTNLVWILAPLMAHYVAAKAGVVGFTRGAARELGLLGITINALAPGANMPSEQMDAAGLERMRQLVSFQVIKRPQLACDLVGAMLFLCSDDADFMSGQVICVDGGIAVP